VLQYFQIENGDTYFAVGPYEQGELDLFFQKNGKRVGVEFKFSNSPEYTKSISYGLEHLKLDLLSFLYPGEKKVKLRENVIASGLMKLDDILI